MEMDWKNLEIDWKEEFYKQLMKCFNEGQCDVIVEVILRAYGFDVLYMLNGVLKDCEIYWYELNDSLHK